MCVCNQYHICMYHGTHELNLLDAILLRKQLETRNTLLHFLNMCVVMVTYIDMCTCGTCTVHVMYCTTCTHVM